jgi:hypothetical protein
VEVVEPNIRYNPGIILRGLKKTIKKLQVA